MNSERDRRADDLIDRVAADLMDREPGPGVRASIRGRITPRTQPMFLRYALGTVAVVAAVLAVVLWLPSRSTGPEVSIAVNSVRDANAPLQAEAEPAQPSPVTPAPPQPAAIASDTQGSAMPAVNTPIETLPQIEQLEITGIDIEAPVVQGFVVESVNVAPIDWQ